MGKKLSATASSEAFVKQGEEAVIRMQSIAGCEPLAGPIGTATSALRSARDKRYAAEMALVPIRVKCNLADHRWDLELRSIARHAATQPGGLKGPTYRELLPEGVAPWVLPSGAAQRESAAKFLAHLASCTTPGVQTVRAEFGPKLQQAYDALAAAFDERKAADAALFLARAEEQAARRDFQRTIGKAIAQVRALFPEDRAMVDVAFPTLPRGDRDEDEAEEGAPATLGDE